MSTWDDKPNDYKHALDEIDRLQAALNVVIEECARVADNVGPDPMAVWISAAIRALKDKT